MSLAAGATLLGAVGHLANLGQFVEIGQGHAYQREQMAWARRAYCLDSRALRIDLMNAVKEDVRDHHQTYAGRIDTLLLVHTLLFTFSLATLQYSDEFVPQSGCVDCVESLHPWLVIAWVYAVSAILILPFWSMVMLIWSKLQLDRWLESALGRLNLELRGSLAVVPGDAAFAAGPAANAGAGTSAGAGMTDEQKGADLLDRVEGAVTRLSGFVVDHQESFKRIWGKECRTMISASTVFLWVSCVLAIGITAGMFWLFLQNHMEGKHKNAGTHFLVCTLCGLLAPAIYALAKGGPLKSVAEDIPAENFEDCIEAPLSLEAARAAADALDAQGGGALGMLRSSLALVTGGGGGGGSAGGSGAGAGEDGRVRAVARTLAQVARWPLALARGRGVGAGGLQDGLSSGTPGAREPFGDGWARMDDEGGICLAERFSSPLAGGSADDGSCDALPAPAAFFGGGGSFCGTSTASSSETALLGGAGGCFGGGGVGPNFGGYTGARRSTGKGSGSGGGVNSAVADEWKDVELEEA